MLRSTLLIFLLMGFACPLFAVEPKKLTRGENFFIIGVGNYDYLPHTGFKDGKFGGFGYSLLEAFAKTKGYTFEYRAVPVARMFKIFLDERSTDFLYPNNYYWNEDAQKKHKVVFSDPITAYTDGIVVRKENKDITLEELHSFGIIKGFTPAQYQTAIAQKKIKVYEHNDVVGLLKMVLSQRIQGVYLNPVVADYYLKQEIKSTDSLVLAKKLPHIKSYYHLSTIDRTDVLQEFNSFLKREKEIVDRLKVQYRLQNEEI
ncbi:substrate-binding periplasmic protein [Bdellovibrio bacteriovorus]|uniref:substrate-binding periplasmic protein n=1 Tax=Bdellovibrio bacteriovorus TaxID=959 RepID=UPI0035A71099